jgi:hypothetical protein
MWRMLKFAAILIILELVITLMGVVPAQAAMSINLGNTSGNVGTNIGISGNASSHGEVVSIRWEGIEKAYHLRRLYRKLDHQLYGPTLNRRYPLYYRLRC